MKPFIFDLYSSLTGITKRLLRIVITFSIKYFEYVFEWINEFNLFLISCSNDFLFLLNEANFFDALSATSSSEIKLEKILFSKSSLTYSSLKYSTRFGQSIPESL